MEKMKIYSFEEVKDEMFGKVGTPIRDEYEAEVQDYFIGEAIKEAREAQNLTQEQLGELVGLKKSQVSRMEKNGNMRFSMLAKVFSALKVPVTLEIGNMRRLTLC